SQRAFDVPWVERRRTGSVEGRDEVRFDRHLAGEFGESSAKLVQDRVLLPRQPLVEFESFDLTPPTNAHVVALEVLVDARRRGGARGLDELRRCQVWPGVGRTYEPVEPDVKLSELVPQIVCRAPHRLRLLAEFLLQVKQRDHSSVDDRLDPANGASMEHLRL